MDDHAGDLTVEQEAWMGRALDHRSDDETPPAAEPSGKDAHVALLKELGAQLQVLKAKADPRLKDLVGLFTQAAAAVKGGAEDAGERVAALQSALADDGSALAEAQARAEAEAAEQVRLAEERKAAFQAQRVIAMQGLATLSDPRVRADRDKIETELIGGADAAVSGNDMGTAETLLSRVDPQVAVVRRVMERFAASDLALAQAREAVARVPGEFVRADREAIERDFIATAAAAAGRRDFDAATRLLAQVDPACALAQGVAARHAAYEQTLLVAQTALATLTEAVIADDKARIQLELLGAAATEAAARRHDAADLLLAQVAARVATAKALAQKAAAFATKLGEVKARIALIVDPVAGPEKTAANQICVNAEAAAALPARDYDAALALLATAGPTCDQAELRVRRYAAGLARAKPPVAAAQTRFRDWSVAYGWPARSGDAAMPGITDVVEQVRTENIVAAETHAAAGRFVEAMRLLEATAARLAPAQAALEAFIAYLLEDGNQVGAHNASRVAVPVARITEAYDALLAPHYYAAQAQALAGNYDGAKALCLAWAAQRAPIDAAATKWTAAVAAHATLAAEAGIAVQAGQLKTELIDAAAEQIGSGALAPAQAKLELAVARCPRLLAYGVALKAAEAAMAADMLAADAAQIRKDLIVAAATSAAAHDYDTAIALLGRVPAETAAAAAAQAKSKLAKTAQDEARPKVDAIATDPAAALAAVRGLVTGLEGHAMAARPPMQAELAKMNKAISDADALIKTVDLAKPTAAQDLAPALALLSGVQGATAALVETMGTMARAEDRIAALRLVVDAIDAEADVEKGKIKTDFLDKAAAELATPDTAKAMELVSQAEAKCVEARLYAQAALAYKAELLVAQTDLATLTDPFLDPDKAAIQLTMIDAAGVEATARRAQAARDKLKPVAEACATARLILKQKALQDPLKVDFERNLQGVRDDIAAIATFAAVPADLAPGLASLETSKRDAAAAKITGRGTGPAALTAMQEATELLTQGLSEAGTLWARSYACRYASYYFGEATAAIAALKTIKGNAEVAQEVPGLESQLANANQLWSAGEYAASRTLYEGIKTECAAATLLATAAGTCSDAMAAALLRIATCKGKVDALAPASGLITAALQAITTEAVTPAQGLFAGRDYKAAEDLLKTVDKRCDAVEAHVTAEELYRPALAAAGLEVAKLAQPAVAAEALRLNTLFIDPAKAAATRLDHAAAMALLGKVAAEVAAALAIGTGGAQAQSARDAAAGDLAGPLPGAILALTGLLAPLLTHGKALAIKDLTDPIAAVLTAVKLDPPPVDAAAQLALAADRCVAARLAAERHLAFDKALKTAEDALALLTDPLIAADVLAIRTQDLTPAKTAAAGPGRDFATAWVRLDAATAAMAAARKVLEREEALKLSLAAATTALGELRDLALPENAAIAVDAAAIQTGKIDQARTLAALPGRDHAAAEALLKGVVAACKTLALRKKAAAGGAPTPAEIEALIKESGGTEQVDKMVAALPDNTARGVMEALITARFGLSSFKNLKSDGSAKDATAGKALSLKKVYELMSQVPDSHTRDNPCLAKIEMYGGKATLPENVKRGSYFAGGDKRVVLSCGRAKDADKHPLDNVALALPDVEPDCEMVPEAEVPTPTYFDWTTLHEIGHAIDDKKRFMQSRTGDAAFGGWQVHGADVMPAARAIAKACRFDGPSGEAYLASLLLGGKPVVPAAPPTRVADWEACRLAAVAWYEDIRVGKQLWESGGRSAARAVDGRVHHEAYAGTWVSYDLAARGKGLTGYQFRAPGEWLSELYAAYHSSKLKDSHPSAGWLATL